MTSFNTLLLAAGKSSRIASFVDDLPKPLIPISGDAIILRNLRWISSVSCIRQVWINLHYQHELMRYELEKFSSRFPLLQFHFVYEDNLLGTAGALANIPVFSSTESHSLVIYGDNLFNFDLNNFINEHYSKKNLVTIALFDERKNINTGIAGGRVSLGKDFRITEFIEGASCAQSHYVNAGVYLLAREIISHIPQNQFSDFGKHIFPKLLSENIPLHGHVIHGYCLGIDTLKCFSAACELVNQKKVVLL